MTVKLVQQTPRVKRKMRSPQHPFAITAKPWQVQPMHIAPVLAGETMKNLMLMSRIVSDPLTEKLTGWWSEYYFFYVKHTDLDIRDDLVEMHLDTAKDMSLLASPASAPHFHNGGINFVKLCQDKVIEHYFRDEDDTDTHEITGQPIAKINHDGWWQSAKLSSVMPANDHELAGENPQLPDAAPPGMEAQYAQWEAMNAAGLTEATFEDYLRSHGAKVESAVQEDLRKPELLRYAKNFTYPTNTVDPATGTPSSAAVWSVSERADKDRYFPEPGFIVGYQVIRPKVLLSNITGSLTSYMDHGFNWLPAILRDMPFASLETFASGQGPAPELYGEDYWVDIKDLLIYGEQFRNTDDVGNKVALPDTTFNHEYASALDADAAFLDAAGGKNLFRTDGIVTLQVASAAYKDTSR